MAAGSQPDYDALAQKYGAVQAPDYDALAQKYGATTPAAQEPSAGQRFWTGLKAGMGGENALNTAVDPAHPISSNPMIPGAGVYRDIKAGNYAGAAGRVVGPAAELGVTMLGARAGEAGERMPAVEPAVSQPSVLGTRVKAVGKVAAQDAASHVPVAGRLVRRPSIGDYWKAITAKPIPTEGPVYPGAPYPTAAPEQLDPSLVSPSRTLPGENPPLVVNRPQPAKPIPSRPGLMLSGNDPLLLPERTAAIPLPERMPVPRQAIHGTTPSSPLPPLRTVEPPEAAPPQFEQPPVTPVTRKQVGAAVDKSFGVEPLKPNVRLRDQLKASPKAEPVSEKKVESSVIHSHDYDPAAKELHIVTKSNPGTAYVYGDVSPEQAQAFESASSKGKAWAEFKKGGSPLVAKIVNGNRVPVRPVIAAKDLNPEGAGPKVQFKATARPGRAQVPTGDDLVPLLKKSVKQARAKRSTAAD